MIISIIFNAHLQQFFIMLSTISDEKVITLAVQKHDHVCNFSRIATPNLTPGYS
jgi:hypothetical protein